MTLAEKYDVEYDGWGTYYEDPNGEDEEGDDDEDPLMKTTTAFATR